MNRVFLAATIFALSSVAASAESMINVTSVGRHGGTSITTNDPSLLKASGYIDGEATYTSTPKKWQRKINGEIHVFVPCGEMFIDDFSGRMHKVPCSQAEVAAEARGKAADAEVARLNREADAIAYEKAAQKRLAEARERVAAARAN